MQKQFPRHGHPGREQRVSEPVPRLAQPSTAGGEITKNCSRYFELSEGPAAEDTSYIQSVHFVSGFLILPASLHMTVAEMEAEGLSKLGDPWHSCHMLSLTSSCTEEILVKTKVKKRWLGEHLPSLLGVFKWRICQLHLL